MRRLRNLVSTGIAIGVVGLLSVGAQETKKDEPHRIPGGIPGRIRDVDREMSTITIITDAGAARTFKVDDETMMMGPRGGKVRRRLHDPRFHPGMELTIVASGSSAEEIHLGFQHGHAEAAGASGKGAPEARPAPAAVAKGGAPAGTKVASKPSAGVAGKPAAAEEEDEDDEVLGTVKSYNSERRLLVVTLLNGTSRPFFLSRDLKVLIGRAVSKDGVADPALKEGAHVTVFTEEGGRRVKELRVETTPARRLKKAG
jgi:hypothetical protein